jgi:hypothetical protein
MELVCDPDAPAPTRPVPGDGVVLHGLAGCVAGTIRRVSASGRCVWFTLDAGGASGTFHDALRALRQTDGSWREDCDQRRVDVGVRTCARRHRHVEAATARSVADLEDEAEHLEPWLRKKRWYSMSSMMIPGVLRSALLARMEEVPVRDDADAARLAALRDRVATLRRDFSRS